MIKTAIVIMAMACTVATAKAQPAPEGYVQITSDHEGGSFYLHLASVKTQIFINAKTSPKLASGSMWALPRKTFLRVVANCGTFALAEIKSGPQGEDFAGAWQTTVDGTMGRNLALAMCAIAYTEPATPSKNWKAL
jgi:hypothetical protein